MSFLDTVAETVQRCVHRLVRGFVCTGQKGAMTPQQLLQLADTLAKRQAGADGRGLSSEALLLHIEV